MRLKTDGIVIRETTTGESDRVVTLLTRDMGVIRAFSNGSKTIKSRTLSGTQLLCYSDLSIYSGREAYVINEALPKKVFFSLRNDIEKLALAQYFCELFAELSPREDNAGEYLRLMLNSLNFLTDGTKPQPFIKAVSELRLMTLAGYMPDLVACGICGKYEDDIMYFDAENGKLICQDCGAAGDKLSLAVVTAMRYICYSEFKKIYSFSLPDSSLKLLSETVEKYLLTQLKRGFKTLDFYKRLTK